MIGCDVFPNTPAGVFPMLGVSSTYTKYVNMVTGIVEVHCCVVTMKGKLLS